VSIQYSSQGLAEDEVGRLREVIDKNHHVEGDLRREVQMNISVCRRFNVIVGFAIDVTCPYVVSGQGLTLAPSAVRVGRCRSPTNTSQEIKKTYCVLRIPHCSVDYNMYAIRNTQYEGGIMAKAGAKGRRVAGRKERKNVPYGRAYVHATFNNTIITVTDQQGNALAWSSAGTVGFKGSRKSTPYAAQLAAQQVAKNAQDQGVREVDVFVKGPGPVVRRLFGHCRGWF